MDETRDETAQLILEALEKIQAGLDSIKGAAQRMLNGGGGNDRSQQRA